MRNERRRHAMMGVEGKRKTVVMRLRVDEASVIRGFGTSVRLRPRRCAAEAQSDGQI